ncbi:competence protein CoiA family protein [Zobellella taiwanensis]
MELSDNGKEQSYQTTERPALRVPYGLKNGRLLSPSDVTNGKACGCICPGCQKPLVANHCRIKRDYFSHYQGAECAGGYESAVHLMAKQVIEDNLKVFGPSFQKTLIQTLTATETMQRQVVKDPEWLLFESVELEVSAEGLRPDIVGKLSDGTPVYIEVFVTHSVSDEKRERFADSNMFELDLSHLPHDSISDLNVFTKEVLEIAPRYWVGCNLYDLWLAIEEQNFSDYMNAHRKNHAAMLERERKIVEKRLEIEKIETAKKEQIINKREELRGSSKDLLDKLYAMVLHGGDARRDNELNKKAEEWKPKLLKRYQIDSWPAFLELKVKGDWVFNVHRSMWQAYIYQEIISKTLSGSLLHTYNTTKMVVDKFGILDWASKLIQLKREYKKQGKERGQWYGDKGVWFFDDEENRMIPSPYAVIIKYLESLSAIGILKKLDNNFVVIFNNFPDFIVFQNQRRMLLEQRKEDAERFEREREERQEEFRAKSKERTEQRIESIVTKVAEMKLSGVTDSLYCQKCCNFQQCSDAADKQCNNCGGLSLLEVSLTEEYLASLPYRLRCAPGIYYGSTT